MKQKMNPTELFNWSDKPVEGGGGGFGQVYKVICQYGGQRRLTDR
jgi:hypothetical protein